MTEKEKAKLGQLYNANFDNELIEERKKCKDLCFHYNQIYPSESEKHQEILKQIVFSMGDNVEIIQPFWCDYGYHIKLGTDVFINHNCVMLDCGDITIGNHVFIGPDCGFHAASHPLDVKQRNEGLEYAFPIVVEDDVWIGANVTVLAGVHIGKGCVIGAGSVVNKDVEANMVVAGNPCRVIKKLK